MKTQQYFRVIIKTIIVLLALQLSISAHALSLMRGTATNLTGALGNVQVNYVDDSVSMTGYLDNTGLVLLTNPANYIAARRIQYDLHNQAGNGSIFSFRVDYQPGTTVIGALDPQGFYDGSGTNNTYWGGIAYTTLFDAGFGTYNYNTAYAGEWEIEYMPGYVTWRHLGNGFFPDTATGLTNFGFNPTFALYFDPSTQFGLQPADVTGRLVTGAPVSSIGTVLSAVPEPSTYLLFGMGLLGLIVISRHKKIT
ncbi:MAG: hypothetical protein BMS9Abin26_0134 [Gammaproteobacteria bacterium]|nr:MAG: hypothetical protein BMS9Abin26_0134 [Gammaproteobacteria bacterium]